MLSTGTLCSARMRDAMISLYYSFLQVEIEKFKYVAVSCTECRLIRLYNPRQRLWVIAYNYKPTIIQNAVAPSHLCHGGPEELIALDKDNSSILIFDIHNVHFNLKYFPISLPRGIIADYVSCSGSENYGQLLITSTTDAHGRCDINAMTTHTLDAMWSFPERLTSKTSAGHQRENSDEHMENTQSQLGSRPAVICSDGQGRLFVAAQADDSILVLDGCTGQVIQVLPVAELKGQRIKQMEWSNSNSHLIILHQVYNM